MTDTEVKTALCNSAAVELTYQRAIDGTGDKDNEDNEDNGGKEDDAARIGDVMGWVDAFIFNTRRKGGQQMEASVLKLYKVSMLHGSLWPIHAHRLTSGMAT
jgi:hypothetical protein